jgi:hypothetical protein
MAPGYGEDWAGVCALDSSGSGQGQQSLGASQHVPIPLHSKIVTMLRDIVVTQCAERALWPPEGYASRSLCRLLSSYLKMFINFIIFAIVDATNGMSVSGAWAPSHSLQEEKLFSGADVC